MVLRCRTNTGASTDKKILWGSALTLEHDRRCRTPRSKPLHRCPVSAFQKLISGKYKLRILWDLQNGPKRYGELKSGLLRGAEGTAEIAPRVLSRELKALAGSGLIVRKDYGVVPPKVDYRLTPTGRSFIPVIGEIRKWGERHLNGERLRIAGS